MKTVQIVLQAVKWAVKRMASQVVKQTAEQLTLRTKKRKIPHLRNKTRWRRHAALLTAFFCLITSQGTVLATTANENENSTGPDLYAHAAVLMDARTGRVLFDKNGTEKLPMASTTKIMTCILALEYGNLADYVAVSAHAAGMPKVKLFMNAGEYYRLEDLLYSLMLESHNDSAVAVAEHLAGSVEGFAQMMNQKAKDIGCYDTCFITPNGLDAATVDGSLVHSTTARDLAAIMSYCIHTSPQKEKFLAITGTPTFQLTGYRRDGQTGTYESNGRNFALTNHNRFLSMMEGALSGKTGFTQKAGYCYVGALEREERLYVVALLACGWPNRKNLKWSDAKNLMEYGLEHYAYREVFFLPTLAPMVVTEGIPATGRPYGNAYTEIKVETAGERPPQWLLKDDEEIRRRVQLSARLTAPVKIGDRVGTVSYYLENRVIAEYPIVAAATVKKRSFAWVAAYLYRLYSL